MKKTLITTALLSVISFTSIADNSANTFDVARGLAKTFSISATEQVGTFTVILQSKTASRGPNSRLILDGTIKGLLHENFTLDHTFVNQSRTGVLYTANDSISTIYAGDPTCANGSVPLTVEETLNIVAGTGIYSNVEAGSYIKLKGVINNCASLPEYGQNTFEVVGANVTFSE